MTLSQLIQEVRRRSDMENTEFVTDAEITNYINNSASELYDILVSKFEDYYLSEPVAFVLDNTTNSYILPTDFYKLRGVDKSISGADDWVALDMFNFNERNRRNISVSSRIRSTKTKYRLAGNKLLFTPVGDSAGSYRFWYIPQFNLLASDTDTLDTIQGWEEYVIIDAAIKCLQKEESDVSVLLNQKAFQIQRINTLAANRDAGAPETVSDVYATKYWFEED